MWQDQAPTHSARPKDLEALEQRLAEHRPYLLLAPPRSASTAVGRSLFQHSAISAYVHEPCDLYRHQGAPVRSIVDNLDTAQDPSGLLVKEMTFQLGMEEPAKLFFEHARKPILVLIRDPRLSIESRIRMVLSDLAQSLEAQDPLKARLEQAIGRKSYGELDDVVTDELFPLARTGWHALEAQMAYCDSRDLDYRILDSHDFRQDPRTALQRLCPLWGLELEEAMLSWSTDKGFSTGQLAEQSNWYRRVTQSKGIEPPTELKLQRSDFPTRFHHHLEEAAEIYARACGDSRNLFSG